MVRNYAKPQPAVTRMLHVEETCSDAEALVAAARGGHNYVMELLLSLGGANPDPAPVKHLPTEYSTPMLASIGGESIEVVQCLLSQTLFNPTRRFKGETYYEIARRRKGPLWEVEERILKEAYGDYVKARDVSVQNKATLPEEGHMPDKG
ncbi:histone deacetylase complex subunit (Hos4) [Apiospora aurea]|uniref:Histone deacetylase complex subunit (Hos4) n=1 Tax=Apiospora aurea TaxID=335848 RepID=A0ABR1PU36_9PEZI